MRTLFILTVIFLITGCTGTPKGVHPVDNFSLQHYLGKWYEIARLDHSFERGLDNVTAEYSLRPDGGVRVINRGFSSKDQQWKEAEGKAYFVKDNKQGYLKVSFFGPFYGSYVVFELDRKAYQYAFVAGYNTSYLWLLSRTPTVSQALIDHFIKKSKALGFNTDKLILVKQDNSAKLPGQ
jgi:apolipoprotein D and lipocalin family protein